MPIRRVLTAAAALLLAAPAAEQSSESQPPAGPPPGAPAGVRMDSYAFARQVVLHLRRAGVERPSGRVSLFIGPGNRDRRLSLAETSVPQALWQGVVPLVDGFVAQRAETTPLELSF